jgi:hypothetical protein
MKSVDSQAATTASAVYLLGFSPLASPRMIAELSVPQGTVLSHRVGNLVSWYVKVPRSEFEGAGAEQNLSDPNWLTPRVLAHEATVERLANQLPFYPAPFGTLFSALEKVERLVERNRTALLTFLSTDARHTEYGAKFYVSWAEASRKFAEQEGAGDASSKLSGLDYLRQRKMARDRDAAVLAWLKEQLTAIEQRVSSISLRIVERAIVAPAKEKNWECFANRALLVPRDRTDELVGLLRTGGTASEMDSRYLRCELTGPWPLYSFAPTLDVGEQGETRRAA